MKNKFTTFLIVNLFLILSINASIFTPRSEHYKYRLIDRYAKKMQKEKNFILIGSGGRGLDDVEIIGVTFYSFEKLNTEGARKLLLEVTDEFLNTINSYKKIRQHLRNFPFNSKNLRFDIIFIEEPGKSVPENYIAYISLTEGKIMYANDKNDQLKVIRNESYEEAVKIVNENQPKETL